MSLMPAVFVLIWATGFVVARYGLPYSPPFKFLAGRFALSLFGFLIWAWLSRAAWPRSGKQWGHLAVVAALLQVGYLGGVWSAVKLGIGAGTVALIVSLQPVLTAVWVAWTSSARTGTSGVNGRQWIGLGLGLAGLLLVVWHKLGLGEVTALNLGLSLFALASITVGTLYQKRHVQGGDPRTANAIQMGASLLMTLPFAALETEAIVPDPHFFAALAWSVIALTLGGSSLMYMLIQRGAATAFTSLLYLVPPCTAIMAWVMFGEALGLNTLLGLALTAAGVWMVVKAPSQAPAAAVGS
jgi:drug/metabolite transporter (DMT)-like permease